METLLMIVTVVALALALGLSVLAWRLLRENRLRSLARAEALQALADDTPAEQRFAELDEEGEPLGAWDLRVGRNRPSPRRQTSSPRSQPEVVFGATVAAPAGAPSRRWLALALVGVLMAAAISAVYMLYRPTFAAETGDTAAPVASGRASSRPLELLSLRHSSDADGTFTVTGLVQNPSDGLPVQKVVAIVYVFDRDGNYFASGKASLDFTVLHPGDESPFVVRVPNVTRVSRYRVGFRSEDGGIVTHVDRRGQIPGGTTGGSIESSSVHASTSRRSDRP